MNNIEQFFIKYSKLYVVGEYIFYSMDYSTPLFWNCNKQELEGIIDPENNNEIDFLWSAMLFNLFSKSLFNHNRLVYVYFNDLVRFKFGIDRILFFVYKNKFKGLIDTRINELPIERQVYFLEYSKSNIPKYCENVLQFLIAVENEIPEFNLSKFLSDSLSNAYFCEEFSENSDDLSCYFFKSLKQAINNGCI
jgi:hypothetical protein